jgi:hypothetical protein
MPQDPHSADRDNAPQPPGEAKRAAGAERYPPVDRTDSIKGGEGRSFDPKDRMTTTSRLGTRTSPVQAGIRRKASANPAHPNSGPV